MARTRLVSATAPMHAAREQTISIKSVAVELEEPAPAVTNTRCYNSVPTSPLIIKGLRRRCRHRAHHYEPAHRPPACAHARSDAWTPLAAPDLICICTVLGCGSDAPARVLEAVGRWELKVKSR
jgi:hypothetical protein